MIPSKTNFSFALFFKYLALLFQIKYFRTLINKLQFAISKSKVWVSQAKVLFVIITDTNSSSAPTASQGSTNIEILNKKDYVR